VEEEYLTAKQVAELKHADLSTVYKAIRREELPATKFFGGTVGIKPADAARWEPAGYNGVKRSTKRRGPGRSKKTDDGSPSQAPPGGEEQGKQAESS